MGEIIPEPLATAKFLFAALASCLDGDNFCKSMVHHLHSNLGVTSSFLTKLDKEAQLRWVGRYGSGVDSSNSAKVSVWEKSASAQAIIGGLPVVIANSFDYESNFGDRTLEHPIGIGLMVWPLTHQNQTVGTLGIGFNVEIGQPLLDSETLQLVSLGATSFLMNADSRVALNKAEAETFDDDLITSRDIQILSLMEEGMTHYQIGRVLHLSESTIKQTSSLIYRKLAVNKKFEAIEQAKKLRLI